MKNGRETRPNGVVIIKKFFAHDPEFYMYYVEGSRNGPWDYLRNARRDADDSQTVAYIKLCKRVETERRG